MAALHAAFHVSTPHSTLRHQQSPFASRFAAFFPDYKTLQPPAATDSHEGSIAETSRAAACAMMINRLFPNTRMNSCILPPLRPGLNCRYPVRLLAPTVRSLSALTRRFVAPPPPPAHLATVSSDDPVWFLLADVHICDQTLPRLKKFFSFFQREFCEQQPSQVLFLGDVFNSRPGTDPAHHRFLTDILEQVISAPWSPQVHLLVGNHDMKNRFNRADNSLHPFSLVSGKVHVYAESKRQVLDNRFPTDFIPYHADEKSVHEYISSAVPSADTIAFYHGAIQGAVMNSRTICVDSKISPSNLGRYKRAFLGHFHQHGPVGGDPASSVLYVGAPIQSNMGDAGDLDHGFISYRPAQDKWKLHRNPDVEYFVKIPWSQVGMVEAASIREKKVQVAEIPDVEAHEVSKVRERMYFYGADMVEVKYKPSVKKELPMPDNLDTTPMVTLGDTIPDMVNSFVKTRVNATSPSEINSKLEEKRKSFFLEFIKPYQQMLPHAGKTGKVFQGDLVSITMYNFRGIKGTCVFDLDDLPPSEVFLVSGVNGSGKSTLIESVVWCLYGEFVSKRIPAEEICFSGEAECYVRLKFRNGYSFERSRNGKGKTKKVGFKIIDPDGIVEEHGHDATSNTKYLAKSILHMDCSMFKQTVVIGDNAEQFLRPAGDAGRTECLDKMFGLDFLGDMRKELTQKYSALDDELSDLRTFERELMAKIDSNHHELRSWTTMIKKDAMTAESLTKESTMLTSQLGSMRREKETLEIEIMKRRESLYMIDVRKDGIAAVIRILSGRQRSYQAVDKRHERLRNERDKRLQAEREELLKQQQPLSVGQLVMSLVNRLFQTLLKYLSFEDTSEKSNEAKLKPPQKPAEYEPTLHQYNRQKLEALSNALEHHQCRLQIQLQNHRDASDTLKKPTEKARSIENRIITTDKRLSAIGGQLHLITSQKPERLRKLEQLKQKAEQLSISLSDKQAVLEDRQEKHSLTGFWKQHLLDTATAKGAFMTHCRSAYIAHINKLIPSILSSLCSDSEGLLSTEQMLDFQLTADFQLQPSSGALSLPKRSRGQLTRTYLTLFLAMFMVARSRMQFRPNFVWMDEIIDALDVSGIEGLQAWLRKYCGEEGARAFLLTHREVTGGRTVRVTKNRQGGTEYTLLE
ncbi:P-loop containing nucleoside triphosphate hydrolase protein [Trichophaea hybrida]|nr:P-loop containing nucleoside triphosphate hydrolase protein [Trichophaea hybrida]